MTLLAAVSAVNLLNLYLLATLVLFDSPARCGARTRAHDYWH